MPRGKQTPETCCDANVYGYPGIAAFVLVSRPMMFSFTNVCGNRDSLIVIERLRVRVPAGAAGEFSSPELTVCAGSYSVSVPPPCYDSGT